MKKAIKEQPLISIIIPVYNVEKYLNRCVESAVKQTYANLEIILIDDGSKDKSKEMCDTWMEIDSRIKVIHKENGGLSDARNNGLVATTGEYICFLDSDDWISLDMIEKMYNALKDSKAEISVCRYVGVFLNGEKSYYDKRYQNEVFDQKSVIKKLLEGKQISNHACFKLFKSSILEQNLFPKGKSYEDIYVMTDLFLKCNKVAYIDEDLYFYYQNDAGITKNTTYKNCYYRHDAVINSYEKILNAYPDLYPEVNLSKWYNDVNILYEVEKIKDDKIGAKNLKKIIIKEIKNLPINLPLQPSEKLLNYTLHIAPSLYKLCNKLILLQRKIRGK